MNVKLKKIEKQISGVVKDVLKKNKRVERDKSWMPSDLFLGQPCKFTVITRDGGPGGLAVAVEEDNENPDTRVAPIAGFKVQSP